MENNIKNIEILDVVYSVMGYDFKKHNESTGQISYNCPVCDAGRNKGKLEINYNKLVMKCWSCQDSPDGLSGSLYSLIKEYGNKREIDAYREALKDFEYEDGYERQRDYVPNIFLPKTYQKITPNNLSHEMKQPYNYLIGRGITDKLIEKYEIGFCNSGFYNGRIIIPSYDKNSKLNFFVGRTYIGETPKYLNPEIIKYEVIINESNINWDSTIYLVEGMFDLIGLGVQNTIPLLGKTMSPRLYETLLEKSNGDIIILLDPDAKTYAYKIYKELESTKLSDKIWIVDLPLNLDIAEIREKYGQAGVLKALKNVRKLTIDDYIDCELI